MSYRISLQREKQEYAKITLTERLFSISIILLPFLYQYKGVGSIVSLGEIVVAIFTFVLLFDDHLILTNIDYNLLVFYVISLATTMCCLFMDYFEIGETGTVIARMVLYAFVINEARSHFDIKIVVQFYTIFVAILSIYLIVQYIYYLGNGGYLPIYLNYSWQFPPEARPADLAINFQWYYRPSSLFLEPSYFALYVLPCICLLLFKIKKTKQEIVILFLSAIAILLSTASSGIAGLIIILAVFLFKRADYNSKYRIALKGIVIVTAIIGIIAFFQISENAVFILNRLETGGSINQRITRGWLIFQELPLVNQLIGVGLNNVEPYMIMNNISTIYDEGNLNYSSSFLQTLNYSGIIGFTALLLYVVAVFGKTIKIGRYVSETKAKLVQEYDTGALFAMLLLLCFIMSYESILFTYRFAFLIILFEGIKREILSVN